jgi:hypothetical protein
MKLKFVLVAVVDVFINFRRRRPQYAMSIIIIKKEWRKPLR